MGTAALQSLTMRDSLEALSESEQRTIRNLPARVYYGVNSDEAVALRVLGVPRSAAESLARQLDVSASEPLHRLRARVSDADTNHWKAALAMSEPATVASGRSFRKECDIRALEGPIPASPPTVGPVRAISPARGQRCPRTYDRPEPASDLQALESMLAPYRVTVSDHGAAIIPDGRRFPHASLNSQRTLYGGLTIDAAIAQ